MTALRMRARDFLNEDQLIAVRRRVERDLPHMSWFHSHEPKTGQVDADGQASDVLEDSKLQDLKEKL